MRKLSLTILASLLLFITHAQDPNFSQFFVSPLTLNPALTGKFNGEFRLAGNYRDQWPAITKAFVTSTASLDMPILRNSISELDTWGVGVLAMTDKTANGIWSSNLISVTTAYHKGLDEDGLHQLGIGFQATYNTQRLDGTKLNFEEELDQNGQWNFPTDEPVNDRVLNVNFFDFSTGILYNGSTDGYNNFYIGASAYHLNKPKTTFAGDAFYTLPVRYTVHAGGIIPLGDATRNIYLSSLFSTQNNANNIVLGGAVGFALNDDPDNPSNFYSGIWTRFNNVSDAIIPYVGLEFNGFRLGVSYDVNISALKPASQSRGGIEVSLIYINRKSGFKGIRCPVF
ncbi:MAG: PorP/SprF family type IX secretion system membrane protein [Chitinophagaceae bacterium]|nr:PorP/SprF family type IX secretion system membrane protein [Chitinophagaceae bacterium]